VHSGLRPSRSGFSSSQPTLVNMSDAHRFGRSRIMALRSWYGPAKRLSLLVRVILPAS
jgi:hypothetical protein